MADHKRAAKRDRGTGGLIKIKGCRYYYAQYYDRNGKQVRVSTQTEVKQEAQTTLRNLLTDRDKGITPVSEMRKIKYGELRKALLDDYATRGNKSLLTSSEGNEFICGLKALDAFFEYGEDKPGWPVTRITTDAAREFARKQQEAGLGNATINRSLALLRRMLNLAHEENKIQVVPKIRMLKEPPARKGFLPRDQFNKLLARLPGTLKPLIVFLYYCGVRLGEALQIEWSQVDLKAGLIRLEEEQTKTDEARIVPLPDVLIKMLEPIKPKAGTVFHDTNLRKSWQKACVAVGLGKYRDPKNPYTGGYDGLIIHDLRRSAVRNLIAAGVSEKVAMTISGHKTREVFDRYHIVDTTDVKNAMSLVEGYMPVKRMSFGEKSVKMLPPARGRKRATA
jgi:integrase